MDADASLVRSHDDDVRWWTWAGGRANGLLAAALAAVDPSLLDLMERFDNRYIGLHTGTTAGDVRSAVAAAQDRFGDGFVGVEPPVSAEALKQLKFVELLPPGLAAATLGARAADHAGARCVMTRRIESGA